ncbi:10 TM acyl transferase domain found in Cas1p-domain-containing protein [Pilobolus umbonatus]|nr:10 TM acyl transferase domain found in Cas1p-domain-containing protein [Pilobolus umbonatus]
MVDRNTATHLCVSIVVSMVLLWTLIKYIAIPENRSRCQGMLTEGKWMDDRYSQWQPSGCMSKTYVKKDIAQCVGNKHILFIGDSIMREQFYAMNYVINGKDLYKEKKIQIDQIARHEKDGLTIEMWWDPFINKTKTIDFFAGKKTDYRPSLVIMGSGIWYMQRLDDLYLPLWKTAIDRALDGFIQHSIADRVILTPVEEVVYDLLDDRRQGKLKLDKIKIMNEYLIMRKAAFNHPATPVVIPFVYNKLKSATKNQTLDGLHFELPVNVALNQLALNYRCNSHLHIKYPMDITCCLNYPQPTWYQTSTLVFFFVLVPLSYYFVQIVSDSFKKYLEMIYPTNTKVITALAIFGFSVIYMYIGDRTQIFGKQVKQYSHFDFGLMMAIVTVAGLATLKWTKKEEDAGFLNRDQTNEWKGWMQLIILVYHFTGAIQVPAIYNPIRVLVAAYLFQTGYGHFYFFYKKADFGIHRVLQTLVRLNLLSCVLAYVMKTDYIFYYFSPLVSFWFLVIYVTMRIGSSYNEHTMIIVLKMLLMAGVTGIFIYYKGILETLFKGLELLFNINWSAGDWRFRLSLDAWIVYIGMLCALVTIKINEYEMSSLKRWKWIKYGVFTLSVIGLGFFFYFESSQSKTSYTRYHPYVSWMPILSFIFIRNVSRGARNCHSGFFAFIGKISLETFIGQYHMWLAADTHGLLVILPNSDWVVQTKWMWWVNWIVSSLVFIFICYYLSQATGTLTRWICSGAQQQKNKPNLSNSDQSVPLLPTSNREDKNRDSTGSRDLTANDSPAKLEVEEDGTEDPLLNERTSDRTFSCMSFFTHVTHNYWIKSSVFLILLGVLNRFCQ